MPKAGEPSSERVARLIAERRKILGLSIAAAARQAGIDRATWTNAERGLRDTEDYIFGLMEQVLQWAPGSIDLIRQGDDPVDIRSATSAPKYADAEEELRAIRDNPRIARPLRMMAQSQLDQLAALREAVAEARKRDGRRTG